MGRVPHRPAAEPDVIIAGCSFQTDRLEVEEWHEAVPDAGALAVAVAGLLTPTVTRSLPPGWHGHYDLERAARWIAERDAEGLTSVVVERASASAVGLLLLHEEPANREDGVVRFGYLLAEPVWGRGLGRELVAGLVRCCRDRPEVQALVAGVAAENVPSIRILEGCGFTRLGDADVDDGELAYRLVLT